MCTKHACNEWELDASKIDLNDWVFGKQVAMHLLVTFILEIYLPEN